MEIAVLVNLPPDSAPNILNLKQHCFMMTTIPRDRETGICEKLILNAELNQRPNID